MGDIKRLVDVVKTIRALERKALLEENPLDQGDLIGTIIMLEKSLVHEVERFIAKPKRPPLLTVVIKKEAA